MAPATENGTLISSSQAFRVPLLHYRLQHRQTGGAGVDLEPDLLGVSRTPKLENLGVRQNIWESAIFLKYNIIYS